jgi:hypothetical protein
LPNFYSVAAPDSEFTPGWIASSIDFLVFRAGDQETIKKPC